MDFFFCPCKDFIVSLANVEVSYYLFLRGKLINCHGGEFSCSKARVDAQNGIFLTRHGDQCINFLSVDNQPKATSVTCSADAAQQFLRKTFFPYLFFRKSWTLRRKKVNKIARVKAFRREKCGAG